MVRRTSRPPPVSISVPSPFTVSVTISPLVPVSVTISPLVPVFVTSIPVPVPIVSPASVSIATSVTIPVAFAVSISVASAAAAGGDSSPGQRFINYFDAHCFQVIPDAVCRLEVAAKFILQSFCEHLVDLCLVDLNRAIVVSTVIMTSSPKVSMPPGPTASTTP